MIDWLSIPVYAARDPYGNRPLCLGTLLTARRSRGGSEKSGGDGSSSNSECGDDAAGKFGSCRGVDQRFGGEMRRLPEVTTDDTIFRLNRPCNSVTQIYADGYMILKTK